MHYVSKLSSSCYSLLLLLFSYTDIHFFHTIRHVWRPEKLSLALELHSYVLRMIVRLILDSVNCYTAELPGIARGSRRWLF